MANKSQQNIWTFAQIVSKIFKNCIPQFLMNFVPRLFVWVSEGPHILELLHILRHHVGIGLPADFFTAGIGPL